METTMIKDHLTSKRSKTGWLGWEVTMIKTRGKCSNPTMLWRNSGGTGMTRPVQRLLHKPNNPLFMTTHMAFLSENRVISKKRKKKKLLLKLRLRRKDPRTSKTFSTKVLTSTLLLPISNPTAFIILLNLIQEGSISTSRIFTRNLSRSHSQ